MDPRYCYKADYLLDSQSVQQLKKVASNLDVYLNAYMKKREIVKAIAARLGNIETIKYIFLKILN